MNQREIKFRYRLQSYTSRKIITKIIPLKDLEIPGNGVLVEDRWGGNVNAYKILSRDEFTGLPDKNKKEIYEGDIIKLGEDIYEVEWGASGFLPFIDRTLELGIKYYEVIGNIYENPELLK